jgi:hypothetical protein
MSTSKDTASNVYLFAGFSKKSRSSSKEQVRIILSSFKHHSHAIEFWLIKHALLLAFEQLLKNNYINISVVTLTILFILCLMLTEVLFAIISPHPWSCCCPAHSLLVAHFVSSNNYVANRYETCAIKQGHVLGKALCLV